MFSPFRANILAAENKKQSSRQDVDMKLVKPATRPQPGSGLGKVLPKLLMIILLAGLLLPERLQQVQATVLMRVCDASEIKSVTSRVCMLYKRNKNSDLKIDRQGNMIIAGRTKGTFSAAQLANECCNNGCPPHVFASNC